jgi:hypothetical protein
MVCVCFSFFSSFFFQRVGLEMWKPYHRQCSVFYFLFFFHFKQSPSILLFINIDANKFPKTKISRKMRENAYFMLREKTDPGTSIKCFCFVFFMLMLENIESHSNSL